MVPSSCSTFCFLTRSSIQDLETCQSLASPRRDCPNGCRHAKVHYSELCCVWLSRRTHLATATSHREDVTTLPSPETWIYYLCLAVATTSGANIDTIITTIVIWTSKFHHPKPIIYRKVQPVVTSKFPWRPTPPLPPVSSIMDCKQKSLLSGSKQN